MRYDRHRALIESGAWAVLSPPAKAALFVLEHYMNDKGGAAWPSRLTLQKESELRHKQTVRKALAELSGAGLIRIEDRGPGAPGRPRFVYHRTEPQPGHGMTPLDDPPSASTGSRRSPQPGHAVAETGSRRIPLTGKEPEKEPEKRKKPDRPPLADRVRSLFPDHEETILKTFQALAQTRKGGKVRDSVLHGVLDRLSRFPAAVVVEGCQTYTRRGYHLQGKDEKYLLGIISNLHRKAGTGQAAPREPDPDRDPTDPGGGFTSAGDLAARALADLSGGRHE